MWKLKSTTICYCVFKIKEHLQLKNIGSKPNPFLKYEQVIYMSIGGD